MPDQIPAELFAVFSITGRLTDHSGNPVEGVPVTITGTVTITKLSFCDGSYSFTGLPGWGHYRITPGPLRREGSAWTTTPGWHQFDGLQSDTRADFILAAQLW